MNSIGDLIDKLIIENIKLFSIRDKIHNEELTDEEKTNLYETMSILNENRGIICNYLDNFDSITKIRRWSSWHWCFSREFHVFKISW